MLGYLRLFHFNKDEKDISIDSGEVLKGSTLEETTLGKSIENFFFDHAINCNDDKNIQNFRFQNKFSQIIQNTIHSFNSIDDFTEHSKLIAEKLKNSLSTNTMKNDFYLIIFTTKISDEDCLCIFRMEANIGIQVSENFTLNTLERMLPDKKSRLQKAAILFKKNITDFYENKEVVGEERSNIHSRIIDRVDPGISGYFFRNFLDSERVIDNPETSAQNAIDSIVKVSLNYLNVGISKKDIETKLKQDLSVEKTTSFESLTNVISDFLSEEKLNNDNLDIEKLANKAYLKAKEENNTVIQTFDARVRIPPKVKMNDVTGLNRFSIYFYKSLRDQGMITYERDQEDNDYWLLRINDEILTIID